MMTQTLPRLFPLNRLSLPCRMPFWAQAAVVCAVFAIVGGAVVDSYGVTDDEANQRQTAAAYAAYALGVSEGTLLYRYRHDQAPKEPVTRADGTLFRYRHDRYYGVVFEMPLLLLERALGLQDTRSIYLTRHLLTHLFFIAGGFVCGMLAYRMAGSRLIALFAMLLFLLHPRLYAHSFVNTKDIPFAVLMVIALYLAHRAFRKDTLGAFLMCGIVAGLAMNLRPFGLILLPMLLAMRAPDLWRAGGADRKHILLTGATFLAAALATLYISHPYYWENPLRLIESLRVLSQHPAIIESLFMGEIHLSDALPWNYFPVWFAITAPPLTLILGSIGCAAVCWQGASRPLAALIDRESRFRVMLLGCLVMTVAVIIALQSSDSFNGWRHLYFLWGPFCLLAAVGLHHIANINVGMGIWKVGARLPGWVRGGGRLHMARRPLAYGVAGAGLITTATAMAALHPHQQVYFNALVDTKTPGALAKRYDMDYWFLAHRQLLEHLLARYPDDTLNVWPQTWRRHILPQNDSERIISLSRNPHAADFYVLRYYGYFGKEWLSAKNRQFYLHPRIDLMSLPEQPPFYAVHAYGSVIASIVARDVEAYHAAYDDVAANGDPLARTAFDIYAYDGALYYLSADCPPPAPSQDALRIFLHITPADLADLPADSREHGFENRDFWLGNHAAAFFDGKCMHRQPLPDYPIARVSTGEFVSGEGAVWRTDINLAARAAAQAVYDGILAGDYGAPVAQSHFDVYMRGNALTYLRSPCAPEDTAAHFFLHIIPTDPADLPADSHESGFANLDFQFADHGADIGGKCVASLDLPDYPLDRIHTGQFVSGEGRVWSAEFPIAR